MTACWYVLHSKPNHEQLLWEQLSSRKMETFYPRIRVQTVNPRARKVKPYFPGYVFIQATWKSGGRKCATNKCFRTRYNCYQELNWKDNA